MIFTFFLSHGKTDFDVLLGNSMFFSISVAVFFLENTITFGTGSKWEKFLKKEKLQQKCKKKN